MDYQLCGNLPAKITTIVCENPLQHKILVSSNPIFIIMLNNFYINNHKTALPITNQVGYKSELD